MTNEFIQEKLTEKFGDAVSGFRESYGILRFEAPKEMNLKVLNFLFDNEEMKFRFLTDLCGAHYPERKGTELEVVYHLHNLTDNIRLRFCVSTDVNKPDVYSATGLFLIS
ncbi:MAG: NADH-quinone oxidoreductase subunit C [Chitinophagaceae bacterium]|nr:NADH-quinone oxidoreductase subunit C [Chitinophagaceae bacterium]